MGRKTVLYHCTDVWEIIHMTKATKYEEMIGVFTPFPLEGENYDEFYVNTSQIRSVMNASNNIINTFLYSPNPTMKVLFMGHKGCGKSTEIMNISRHLQNRYEIINFSIAQEVELSGIQYIDVIFAIMGQVIDYLSKQTALKVDEGILDKLVNYWRGEEIFEKVVTDQMEMETGAQAKLSLLQKISVYGKGILKAGAESKKTIRNTVEPKISYLISMINEIISDMNAQLKRECGKEILVIIEDLDKLDIEDARHIFVSHRKTLLSLAMKMIIAFPIYMVYTADFAMIRDDFDSCVLYSMIKVQNSDRSRNEEGIDILKQIVYKRMEQNLIKEDALDFMVSKSGGAIRDLFYMLEEAALYKLSQFDMNGQTGMEPISMDEAKIVCSALKSIYERNITSKEQFDKLVEIYHDPQPENTDEVLSELLKSLSVIEYNGERWCGVHPVLVDFLKEKNKLCEDE